MQNANNPGNPNHTLQDKTFDLNDEGSAMIMALNAAWPQQGKCFNLYKQQNGTDPIGICALTGTMASLGLRPGQVLYYKIENE